MLTQKGFCNYQKQIILIILIILFKSMNQEEQEMPEVESQTSLNQIECKKPASRDCSKILQDIVNKNDVQKANLLLQYYCTGVQKIIKCKNADSRKKLAQLDKETLKILMQYQNKNKQNGQRAQRQLIQKINQTDQECKSKMVQKKDTVQNQKRQYFVQFLTFVEQLVKHYQIKNQNRLIQDIKSNKFKLIKYYDYKIGDQDQWKNFISCIQSFPEYSDYRKYLGVNIKMVKRNFQNWLKNKLINNLQFNALDIDFLTRQLVQNPLWPYWNDKRVSDVQKQSLFKILYEQEEMFKYELKLQIPQSLQSQNFKIIEEVLNQLIGKHQIRINQIQQCIQSLENNDDIKFYSLASITMFRKNVSKFFDSNGQSFFFQKKNIIGEDCPKKLQTQTILQIRKLLHSLNINFDLYQQIEDKLMSLKIDELWDVMIQPTIRQKIIRKFESDKLFIKYRKYKRNIETPLEIKVKNEIIKTLLFLDFKNLEYKQMKNFAEQMIKKKVNFNRFLTFEQVRQFEQNILKCENVNKFLTDCRVNIIQDQGNLKQKILFICNQCPELLRLASIKSVMNLVLNTSNILAIHDLLDISPNQKKYLVEALVSCKEYEKFKSSYEKIQAIKAEKKLQQQITRKFTQRGRALFSYYQLFGRFEQKSFDLSSQSLPQLKNFQTRLKQIQELEESQIYKKFKRNFELLFKNNKTKIQQQFSIDVRFLLQRRRGNIDQIIRDLQQCNYQIQKSIPVEYRDSIKADVGYKELMKWKNAQSFNSVFFAKNSYQRKITHIYYHPSVLKYNLQERTQLVDGILANGVHFLNKTDLIRKNQKQQLRILLVEEELFIPDIDEPQTKEELTSPEDICYKIKQLLPFQFIEKMTPQEVRSFFRDYPFSQEKITNICSQYGISLKKKSTFKDCLNKKELLLPKLQQLQKLLPTPMLVPSPVQTSNLIKPQKKQIAIDISESPKNKIRKSEVLIEQPEVTAPIKMPVVTPVKRKSKEEASKQIIQILTQSGAKSEKYNSETVMGFFKNQFNPEEGTTVFGISALKKKLFNDHLKNNLDKIKQLSKSFE